MGCFDPTVVEDLPHTKKASGPHFAFSLNPGFPIRNGSHSKYAFLSSSPNYKKKNNNTQIHFDSDIIIIIICWEKEKFCCCYYYYYYYSAERVSLDL